MTVHKTLTRAVAAFAALALGASAAKAAIVYSDFSVNGPSEDYSGLAVSGVDSGYGLATAAARFTAFRAFDLSEIQLSVSAISPTALPVTVSLWTDAGQSRGQQLGAWQVSAPSADENPPPLVTITDVTGITLDVGQSYYLQVAAQDADLDAWWLNAIGASRDLLINDQPTPSARPAPTFQVSGNPIGAPEPDVWALMTVGIGLAGAALRRRRTQSNAQASFEAYGKSPFACRQTRM